MHKEVIEITLEEFTKITGDVEKLRSEVHQSAQLAEAYKALLAISPDPARELQNLRNKIEEKSGEILKLRGELDSVQTTKKPESERRSASTAKFRKDLLISSVLEMKPDLSSEEKSFLHLILPLVDRMWANALQAAQPTVNPLEEKLTNAELQIATLREVIKKNSEETSRLKIKNEGLEGNVEALQTSIEFLMTESESLRKKIKQLEEYQDILMGDVRTREEELEQCRPFAKEKYDLELTNRDLELQLEKAKRTCESLKADMEELAIRGVTSSKQDTEPLRTEIERLQKALKETQSELGKMQQANASLAARLSELSQKHSGKEQVGKLQHQLKVASAELSDLRQQLEDAQAEKDILAKRSAQETKELRGEVAREKNGRQEALKALEDCRGELHRTQEVKLLHARVVAASANEKRFVETLRNRVDELEAKNKFLLVTMQQVDDIKQELIREKQRSTQLSEELKRMKPNACA